ncbi:MAG: hypothetical protein ABSC90_10675 [Acidimicrobiales bacterium]
MDAADGSTSQYAAADGPRSLVGDINFEVTPGGFEVWYSDRVASAHPDLVDESADWLEDLGVVNLGQVDYKVLMADGVLTDEIKEGLEAWWRTRIEDLDLD